MFQLNLFQGPVEFMPGFRARAGISDVLFDFDGTLSLIREGWPKVMLPMFLEMLPKSPEEPPAALEQMLLEDILRLNGKQTIYQMIQFAERVRERGGEARDPLWYKQEYARRLDERIEWRRAAIRSGSSPPDEFLVFRARNLLEALKDRGLRLYLASGTDEGDVRAEAGLLQLTEYFGDRIYGARDDYKTFSKKMVIDRLLAQNGISGENLLAFGDGYVEIENVKAVGGLAVAVASDEAQNGSGHMDPWKRRRLVEVGADLVIPDYRDAPLLLRCIFGDR